MAEDTYKLEVSPDKLTAHLSFHRPKHAGGNVPTLAEVHKILKDEGVTYGIHQKEIEDFLHSFAYGRRVLVAEGDPPGDGESEHAEYTFPTTEHVEYDQEELRIDLRKVRQLNEVHPGDLLALKHARTPPKNGMNVYGEPIPAKEGKTVSLKVGKGAKESEDGMQVHAECAGHACVVAGKITVLDTLSFGGDVNFAVGDLEFVGNLEIRGSVMPGFTIITRGNLNIGGSVEAARIDCGGDLYIGGLIFGQDKGYIRCEGNATVRGISRADVSVGGDINVRSYIMHSRVSSGGKIVMGEDKSVIVGETVRAYTAIHAKNVGNRIATPTSLNVGFNPEKDIKLSRMKDEWTELQTRIERARNALTRLDDPALDKSRLNQMQLLQIDKLKQQLEIDQKRFDEVKAEYNKLKESSAIYPNPEVTIDGIIYPGVIISLHSSQIRTQDALKEARYYLTSEKEVAFAAKEVPDAELARVETTPEEHPDKQA